MNRRVKSTFQIWLRNNLNLKTAILLVIMVGLIFVIIPFGVWLTISVNYSSRIYRDSAKVPVTQTAIILGTEEGSDALKERVEAAAELFKAGKVTKLILSGAKTAETDEPAAMQEILKQAGVAESALTVDYVDRTYDSCHHARTNFKLDAVIVVSQEWHLTRALYLCNSLGVKAIGYVANLPQYTYQENLLYEIPSMLKAIWDVQVAPPSEATSGEKITL